MQNTEQPLAPLRMTPAGKKKKQTLQVFFVRELEIEQDKSDGARLGAHALSLEHPLPGPEASVAGLRGFGVV